MPRVLRTTAEVLSWSEQARRQGRLALVPTMGFLHEGHLALMREGRARAQALAVSIFVNPTQFGPKEDLGRYPRDFEGDLAKCRGVGVDAVFAPEATELYPPGHQTFVEVTEVSQGLCGAARPGHFRGVATIVTKLFTLFRPHLALFGEKDFQQLQVIRALARDLHLGVEVVGLPTVREADGLAMSSRNAYLSGHERARALALSRALRLAQDQVRGGARDVQALVEAMTRELEAQDVRKDYVHIVDVESLRPVARVEPGRCRALVAGFVGNTRLIDNVAL